MTSFVVFRQFGSFASQALRPLSRVVEPSRNEFFRQMSAKRDGTKVRGGLGVDVGENNQVERAMRILKRKAMNEKYDEKWRQTYHVKKGEQRRQELKKAKFKIFKAEFRERMKWILQRRARGF
ncbi:hypothetical protein BSKO_08464 [Bryopsis sp. KO-2023]|nr:hypothetical protein BSKO_08464 [Bryopsis sp. KO-2023]